jgi:hypothetical protein
MGMTAIDMETERRQTEVHAAKIRKYYADRGQHGVVVTVQLVPFGAQKTWSCRVLWPGQLGATKVL